MVEYYRRSGKVNPVYFLYVACAVLAVAVTSVIYAIIMFHMPIVYVNFLITIGYGFLLGLASAFSTRRGKLRNGFIWIITVLVFLTVFIYVHLTAYAAVAFRDDTPVINLRGFIYLLTSPQVLFGELYRPQRR